MVKEIIFKVKIFFFIIYGSSKDGPFSLLKRENKMYNIKKKVKKWILTLQSSAEEYLQNRLKNKNIVDYRFILDYTDGQSPYNDDMIGCHCQDYTKYRL